MDYKTDCSGVSNDLVPHLGIHFKHWKEVSRKHAGELPRRKGANRKKNQQPEMTNKTKTNTQIASVGAVTERTLKERQGSD